VADVEPRGPFGFRCRVCGGPRIPVDDATVVRTGREIPVLKRVQRERVRLNMWRVGALVLGLSGLLALLVATAVLLIASPGALLTLLTLGFAAVPLLLAPLAWSRSSKHQQQVADQLRQARALVASDVLLSRGQELSAAELGRLLRLDEAAADHVLTELSVHDFVHARVTDLGTIAYSAPGSARFRVDGAPSEDAVLEEDAVTVIGRDRLQS
jgi:hypothetical protein